MARKLKTYQTSVGFFDLAIAAPSMKAAAEAWGSNIDVFKRGFAKETQDLTIVDATMASPGVVLKRPVGSNQSFSEHAELPQLPNIDSVKESPQPPSTKQPPVRKTDEKSAALAFDREQKKREAARRKEEADREKKRKQREQAIATAEGAFALAEREHQKKVKKIEEDRAAVDERSKAESARWEIQKRKLEFGLRRARSD